MAFLASRLHVLQRTQVIHATRAAAWDFFRDPKNLARITPASMGFQVRTLFESDTRPGQVITYGVRLAPFAPPTTWVTEITAVVPGERFVDEQRFGPYRFWHHLHTFTDLGDGRVELGDLVHYALPFPPFGDLLHPIFIRPQLERIFSHRTEVIRELFPG